MNIEKILNGKSKRSLFDSSSDEFNRSSIEEKLTMLASLNYWNLLDKTIKEYQDYNSGPKDKYKHDSLKPTLQLLISHIDSGESLTSKVYKKLSLKKTVEDLKRQLTKNVTSQFSLRNLIVSYLNNDENSFKNKNKFFRIDFKKDLTEALEQRDILENKPRHESYTHLYTFLTTCLIENFKNNNFQGFMIDMGMDYQTEYIVRHYLQNPNKENYLRAIEYAINILYFKKESYHKFFLFIVHFSEEDIINDYKFNNQVGVRFDTPEDFEDWEKIKNGNQPKQQYAQRWKQLNEAIKENDVIVIASYRNLGYKIGTIIKGTKYTRVEKENEFYINFHLENVVEIDILTLNLPLGTISSIKKEHPKLRKEYHGMIAQLSS